MGDRGSVLSQVLRNPRLRRLELAFVLFGLAEYGVWLAMMVFAYQHGGTTTAALIAALQLVPAAIAAPLIALFTDRHGGAHMLVVGYVLQALSVAATAALILTHGPPGLAYAGAVIAATAVTITRPAQAATLAGQVDRPDELTAASVLNGWADSGAMLAGPGLAGALIAVHGPGLAMAGFAVGLLLASVLVAPVRRATAADRALISDCEDHGAVAQLAAEPQARQAARSLATWTRGPALAVLSLVAVQYIAVGALDVLLVVLAVHTLHLGASFAGYLGAAFGAGGVLGAVAALRLVGATSLARPLCAAALIWAAAFALLGGIPKLGTAIGLLGLAGLARTVLDTAGRALLVRVTPLSRVGRVFGVLEAGMTAALAVGALLVPLFFSLGGIRLTLIALAVLLAGSAVAPLGPLRVADRSAPAIDGLRKLHNHPLFKRLSRPALEELARQLVTQRVVPGERVVTEGEPGELFYLIAEGETDVSIRGDHVRTLAEGEGFGEIALLRNVPRTATVAARTAGVLYGLGRRPFLAAMGADPPFVSELPGHAELDPAPAPEPA